MVCCAKMAKLAAKEEVETNWRYTPVPTLSKAFLLDLSALQKRLQKKIPPRVRRIYKVPLHSGSKMLLTLCFQTKKILIFKMKLDVVTWKNSVRFRLHKSTGPIFCGRMRLI